MRIGTGTKTRYRYRYQRYGLFRYGTVWTGRYRTDGPVPVGTGLPMYAVTELSLKSTSSVCSQMAPLYLLLMP